jgi:hypothetical protein
MRVVCSLIVLILFSCKIFTADFLVEKNIVVMKLLIFNDFITIYCS